MYNSKEIAALFLGCLCLLFAGQTGYAAAVLVREGINFNGNKFVADSYNSSDPAKSTDGQYDPAKAADCGDVVCNSGISNSFGNANIYGRVFTAATTNINLGSNVTVGTHAWQATNSGIESGYVVQNANFTFTNISLPDYSGYGGPDIPGGIVPFEIEPGLYGTNYYDHILCGTYSFTNEFVGNWYVSCPSILVLPNDFTMGSQDSITIAPGASLKIYVGGTSCTINGNGIINMLGLPANFVVYCTSDVTNLTLNGNGSFAGVLIAPSAEVIINGGGSAPEDFAGALLANTLVLDGYLRFHFDEALTELGIVPQAPPVAANLTSPSISGTGQFQFNIDGVPGFSYVVETSTNLVQWTALSTNIAPFIFTDTNGVGWDKRFYRAFYTR
jgi:hypothetical protein